MSCSFFIASPSFIVDITKSVQIERIVCIFDVLAGGSREFCHLETFNATCGPGEVVLIQDARYGRMKVGRCLATSYYVGCYADVLSLLDFRCSGKRNCTLSVLDPELLKFQPCRKDLMAYLEASYTCVTGNI